MHINFFRQRVWQAVRSSPPFSFNLSAKLLAFIAALHGCYCYYWQALMWLHNRKL